MFRNGFCRCRSHPSGAMPVLKRIGTVARGFAGNTLPLFARTLAGGGGGSAS